MIFRDEVVVFSARVQKTCLPYARYDNNQNLASVVLPSGTFSLSDRKWNAPQQITLPGGSVQHREYDPLMRTTRIKTNNTAQSTVMDYRYTFDPVSNITKKATEHGDYEYGYDDLYRLTEVTNPSGLANEAWTYDAVGNRKTDKVRGGSQEWQVNANNQITKSYTENGDPVTPTWDENGSLVKQETVDNKPELNQQYVYDAQNRLTEVKNKEGQRIALYQYDPFGRRIAKTTVEGTVYYLYSDQGLIAEATPSGAITAEYGWSPQQTWGTDPLTITTTRSGSGEKETFYYLNDHLGTPQQIIDSQSQPVWSAKASAFGEAKVQPDSAITNNLRFPGQYYDQETKTHYNFFRDYSSATGTYRQADPIGLMGGGHFYEYSFSNPVIWNDALGLAPTNCQRLKQLGPPNPSRYRELIVFEITKIPFTKTEFIPVSEYKLDVQIPERGKSPVCIKWTGGKLKVTVGIRETRIGIKKVTVEIPFLFVCENCPLWDPCYFPDKKPCDRKFSEGVVEDYYFDNFNDVKVLSEKTFSYDFSTCTDYKSKGPWPSPVPVPFPVPL